MCFKHLQMCMILYLNMSILIIHGSTNFFLFSWQYFCQKNYSLYLHVYFNREDRLLKKVFIFRPLVNQDKETCPHSRTIPRWTRWDPQEICLIRCPQVTIKDRSFPLGMTTKPLIFCILFCFSFLWCLQKMH